MKAFLGKTLIDIVFVGFIDKEIKPDDILLNQNYLYLEFDNDHWAKLSTTSQTCEIKIEHKSNLDFSFEIEEDYEYASTSLFEILVIDTISVLTLEQVYEYKHRYESEPEKKLRALELILSNGEMFFIDCTYCTGFKIGSEKLKNEFIYNFFDSFEGYTKNAIHTLK